MLQAEEPVWVGQAARGPTGPPPAEDLSRAKQASGPSAAAPLALAMSGWMLKRLMVKKSSGSSCKATEMGQEE